MTEPASRARRQAWTVVVLLALPVVAVLVGERLVLGWTLRDPGLLSAATAAPLLGAALVLAVQRRLPGLRTAIDLRANPRVLRRGLVSLLLVLALLVLWNQVCLLLGWQPVPRIDPDAGMPFVARIGLYLPLALAQEVAWRGIVRPTLAGAHGWLAASVGTGAVWGLLSGVTWRFGLGFGLLVLVATVGWSVLLGSVLEEMREGQLVVATVFQWGLMVALFLLLPEETGAWHGAVVLAFTALVAAAAAVRVYGRSRVSRGFPRYA